MKYLLYNANILDGTKNMSPTLGSVEVCDGRITNIIYGKISETEISEKYDEIYDLEGKYLAPGLINLHEHIPGSGKPLRPGQKPLNVKWLVKLICDHDFIKNTVGLMLYKKYLKIDLFSGVTTVRSVGGVSNLDTIIKDLSEKGKITAPRLLASNMAVATKGGHMVGTVSRACENIDEAKKMINELAAQNVDLIKIMITGGVIDADENSLPGVMKMPPEMVKACCDEAHRLGFSVAAHIESPMGIKVAAESGVDTIEHGAPFNDDIAKIIKDRNAAIICTISPAIVGASNLDYSVTGFNKLFRRNCGIVIDGMVECAKKALDLGIPVGLGTDTGCPYTTHYDFYRELYYFTKYCWVSPKFALYTATLGNAKIVKIDSETGSIETGKSADMIVLNNNPLNDLFALRDPYMVIGRGKIYKQPKIKKFAKCEEILDLIASEL